MRILYFFFVFAYSYCFSQNSETIIIKELFIPLKVYENDILVKNEKVEKDFSYLYKLSANKDSIFYYNTSFEPVNRITSTFFILKRKQKNNNLILSIEENKVLDSINIEFFNNSKSIRINTDLYYLNPLYYFELKKSLYENNNILDLIDFLDDNLGDYPYQLSFLKKISSYKKYKNNKLKILGAKIQTNRTQSDNQDIWNVTYNYNKKNILISVIKKTIDNEIGFEKKLVFKNGSEYKYKIRNNVESRFEDNDEIMFDIIKNTYNSLQNHFQYGKIKEEISQTKRVLYQKK
jgi:hypothetical protein